MRECKRLPLMLDSHAQTETGKWDSEDALFATIRRSIHRIATTENQYLSNLKTAKSSFLASILT